MRRAGSVLEGGESFDSSGFYLAGQDEMLGRLNAMSGWQATSRARRPILVLQLVVVEKKSSLRLQRGGKFLHIRLPHA